MSAKIILTPEGRLPRTRSGTLRLPAVELTQLDADRFEQWVIDQGLMDDVKAAHRMALISAFSNPQWARVAVTRRAGLIQFRKALFQKFTEKISEISQEVQDELMLLSNELETMPNED